MSFKDHFSSLAAGYARYRPDYPDALFAWLARQCPSRQRAWDCATGTGQAACALSRHFDEVIAADASAEQVANARPCARVRYVVAPAEASGLADQSVDLITVAQALHWFDLPRFWDEARHVLKPCGVMAVWSYNLFRVAPEVDAVVDHLYRDTLGPWWPPERALVERGYGDLPFPFEELEVPAFAMESCWDLDHLVGYLGTWSAAKRMREHTSVDPLPPVRAALEPWFKTQPHAKVRWPLSLRVGRR